VSEQKKHFSNAQTISFVVIVCFSCALILSLLASGLQKYQKESEALYKSKQLLIAAKLLSYDGNFMFPERNLTFVPAVFTGGHLQPSENKIVQASDSDITSVFSKYIYPRLTDTSGKIYTFEELGMTVEDYMHEHEKGGFSDAQYKLVYLVYYDGKQPQKPLPASAYVLPINGFGLWDAIYGYLCLASNADTIIGTTWYEQAETPGLGGNIALPSWQKQFKGKVVFQKSPDGSTNFQKAPLGITVVKTTVKDEFGDQPKGQSAVDGISGATITSKGVTEAYQNCLDEYRAFLIQAHRASGG